MQLVYNVAQESKDRLRITIFQMVRIRKRETSIEMYCTAVLECVNDRSENDKNDTLSFVKEVPGEMNMCHA